MAAAAVERPSLLASHSGAKDFFRGKEAVIRDASKIAAAYNDPGFRKLGRVFANKKYTTPASNTASDTVGFDEDISAYDLSEHNDINEAKDNGTFQVDGQEDDGEDDDDAEDQADTLRKGASNLQELLKNPIPVPLQIARVAQEACWVFRRAWEHGPSDDRRESLLKAASETILTMSHHIKELRQQNNKRTVTYILDGDRTCENIYLAHNAVLLWFFGLEGKDCGMQDMAGQACVLFLLDLVKTLDVCGLNWKSVIHPEMRARLDRIILDVRPRIGEHLPELLDALEYQEKQACVFQTGVVSKGVPAFVGFFDAVAKKDQSAAQQHLQSLHDLNVMLQKANQEVGLKSGDRSLDLPLKYVDNICKSAGKGVKESDLVKYRQYMGGTMKGLGYEQVANKLLRSAEERDAPLDKQPQESLDKALVKFKEPIAKEWEPVQQTAGSHTRGSPSGSAENLGHSGSRRPVATQDPGPLFAPTEDHAGGAQDLAKNPYNGGIELPAVELNGCTEYGKLLHIQRLPRGAFRTTVNGGTDGCRILLSIAGANYGRGELQELCESNEFPEPLPLKSRKRRHLSRIVDIVTVPRSNPFSKRPGIVKFLLEYKSDPRQNPNANSAPLTEERSRSDCIVLFGKMNVDAYERSLLHWREERIRYLVKAVSWGLHPDTKQAITQEDMKQMPWLFQLATPRKLGMRLLKGIGYEGQMPGLQAIEGSIPKYSAESKALKKSGRNRLSRPSRDDDVKMEGADSDDHEDVLPSVEVGDGWKPTKTPPPENMH